MESVRESVKLLPEQFRAAWEAVHALPLPQQFKEAEKLVVAGMGGSALGGRIVKSFANNQLPIPLEIVTDYDLPEYVDENTLVVISSYSGQTEETLSTLDQALERNAMIFVVTTGGELKERAVREGLTAYIFNPELNPSSQPRMASGYMVGAVIALLSSMRFLELADEDFEASLTFMSNFINEFESETNQASDLANEIKEHIPVLVASGHLVGATHVFKNQLNETSKSFSVLFEIPELNHHLMEGLVNPDVNKNLIFILLKSELYNGRIQKRYEVTKEIIEKNNITVLEYACTAPTKLQQILELLAFGSFTQLYLAELYGVDPVSVPWVDYFKEKLS